MNGPLQPIAGAPAPPLEVPFRALVENVIEGIALVTLDGVLLYGNPRLAQILGRRVDELTGLNLLKCLDPPWRQVARDALARRRGGLADGYDLDVRLSDGDLRHLHVRGAPLRDANGQVSGSVALIHDDTEHHDAELQLVRMALFDPLTGLPNRATLHDRLTHALARGQRNSGTLALLFCDLDEFKQVNDSLGHAAGDELLRIVAGRLAHAVRPADTIGRLGGDEFLVLCEDLPYPTEAVQIAERLQAALRPRLTIAGTDLTVTASIGIAFAPRTPVEPDELLHNADLAMYRAKARGRARYNVYGAEPVNSTTEWLRLVAELRRALDECELVVHYQPRVDLRTLHIVGAEALLRWQHPTRGLLPPGAFLDTAERSGLLDAICEHVLRTACTDAAGWPALEGSQLLISVNVSARQLADNGIVAAVTRALTDSGLDPRRLVLELTETTVIDDVEAALRVFGDLEALGVQVSIDDFGTGSSSLAHLRWLHVDEIKIDHSFFSGFAATGSGGATGAGGSDQTAVDDTAILTSIIDLAHTLAIRAVADGVETPTQHATLLTLGCDHAQGHHYHHPVPADQLLDLIRADRPPRLPDS